MCNAWVKTILRGHGTNSRQKQVGKNVQKKFDRTLQRFWAYMNLGETAHMNSVKRQWSIPAGRLRLCNFALFLQEAKGLDPYVKTSSEYFIDFSFNTPHPTKSG